MKILLFGKDGQVGWELQRSLGTIGNLFAYNRAEANFLNLASVKKIIQEIKPDILVNAAAYTAVDKAETERTIAQSINFDAVLLIAEEIKKINGLFVHYSTDYVFDGNKIGPYLETDPTNPQNVYGCTKRDGENAIIETNCNHLIFRTSWVYGKHGNNFMKTILKLAEIREELCVISDQTGSPTSASLIANVTATCLYKYCKTDDRQKLNGVYHLTANGRTSWYDYAKFILDKSINGGKKMRLSSKNINPILTSQYKQIAKRPLNSRLNTTKLRQTFDVHLPHWEADCNQILQIIIE